MLGETGTATSLLRENQPRKSINYAMEKRWIVGCMLLFAMIEGTLQAFFQEPSSGITAVSMLTWGYLSILWCWFDSRQHKFQMNNMMRLGTVVLFKVTLAIYLLQTRGLGGLLTMAGIAIFATVLQFVSQLSQAATLESLRGTIVP